MLRLLESQCSLPEGYDSLSELICDPMFYPDAVGGEEVEAVNRADYIETRLIVHKLTSVVAVKRAFAAISANASEDDYALLYAGVMRGGDKANAVDTLAELMKGVGRFDANDLTLTPPPH